MNESVPVCARCGGPMPAGMEGSHCPACAFAGIEDPGGDDPGGVGAAAPEFRVRRIGDYELLAELGKGGMGIVYQARQLSLGRFVAVKLLRSGEYSDDEAKARFKREAHLAAKLVHPHIVRIHDAGEHEGQLYFSMDYVPGRSLAELLKKDIRWAPRRAAECVRLAAEAVQAAHSAGVMHRDIKPGNILIHNRDGQPYLTDFGLAKSRDTGEHLTLNGGVGTPSYVAPEQIDPGPNEPGASADIYGLGAVLYHLLTGRPPHEGKTEMQILKHALEGEIRPPNALQPDVPESLAAICLRCLNRNPSLRYGSARELSDALAGWIRALEAPPVRPDPVPVTGIPPRRGRVWRYFFASLSVAAVVSVLGAVAWMIRGPNNEGDKTGGNGAKALELAAQCLASPPSTNHTLALKQLAQELHRDDRRPEIAARLVELIERTPFVRESSAMRKAAGSLVAIDFAPDGFQVSTVTVDGRVQTWDLRGRETPDASEPVSQPGLRLAYNSDGDRLAVIGATNARVHWLGAAGAKPVAGFVHPVHIRSWQFLPGRDEVLTVGEDGGLRAWSLSLGTELKVVGDHPLKALAAAGADHFEEVQCDKKGRHWLLTSADRRAFLWDSVAGRLRALGDADTVVQLARLDPVGGQVWLLDAGGRVSVWDVQTATRLGRPVDLLQKPVDVVFSPDGDGAVSWGDDGGLQRWVGRATTLAGSFGAEVRRPVFVRYSPDGLQVLVGTASGELHVFDARSGEPVVVPWQVDALLGAGFDGRAGRVVTISSIGFIRHWEIPVRANPTHSVPTLTGSPDVKRRLAPLALQLQEPGKEPAATGPRTVDDSSDVAPESVAADPLGRWLAWQRALPSERSCTWNTDETPTRAAARLVREGTLPALETAVRMAPESPAAWAALAEAVSRIPASRRPYTARTARFFAQRARALAPGDAGMTRLVRDVDERLGGAL